MKSAIVILAFVTACFSLHAQQLLFGHPSKIVHPAGNIKASPGIASGRYYMLYDDYNMTLGRKIYMESFLKIFSAAKGNLIRTVHLNPLVSAGVNKYFIKVMVWKGRILGLYVVREPGTGELPLYGQLFSLDGRPEGRKVILGSIYIPANYSNPGASFPELQCGFNEDSSRLVLLSKVTEASDNAAFAVIDTGLHIVRKISCSLPFSASTAALLAFKPSGDTLYVLTRESMGRATSYTLFAVRGDGDRVARIPIWLAGNMIEDARFCSAKSGDVVITGFYDQGDKPSKKEITNGAFTIQIRDGKIASTDVHEFSAEVVAELAGRRAAKKGKGLEDGFLINRLVPTADGGFAVFGQSERLLEMTDERVVDGFFEVYGDVVFYKINAAGKISWCKGLKRDKTHNQVLTTSDGPIYGYASAEGVRVVYDAKNAEQHNKKGIYVDTYDSIGRRDSHFFALPKDFSTDVQFIWNTAQPTGSGQVNVVWYKRWKKQMGVLKVPVP